MVLHALDILMNHSIVNAQESEEFSQQFVPSGNSPGQFLSGGCQNQAAISFIFEKALGIQALNHVCDAGLRNLQGRGDIDDPGVSL